MSLRALHDQAFVSGQPTGRPADQALADPERPLLSVIIPTYNERGNIARLVRSVLELFPATPVEVLVVDDNSPDGTSRVVETLIAEDHRVQLITRHGKQGLASAVFRGAVAANGSYVCTMDGDLSHDPEELRPMLALAQSGADVVIGSRFAPGAWQGGQPLWRRITSRWLSKGVGATLRISARDVLSGYVLCRRELLTTMPTHYSAGGFKFLVELLATHPDIRVQEWPIRFHDRNDGRSKASVHEALSFLRLIALLAAWKLRRHGR